MQPKHVEVTKQIGNVIIDNIKNIFPVEAAGNKTIEVNNVEIRNLDKADPYNYHAVSEAKNKDKTYGADIYGTVTLKHEGRVIDTKKMKLATVPAMINDGTFICDGVQYQIDSQLRLRPAVYSRIKKNGEIEAHINPNGFTNLRLLIDPTTNKLTVNVHQANINAIPVLRMLGVTNEQMKDTFGNKIYEANASKKETDEVKRFWRSIYPKDPLPEDPSEITSRISAAMKEARLDPKVTKITLGMPAAHLDGKTLLRSFEKVINVARGTEQPDDRDALTFKTIHGVEDFVNDRLKKNIRQIKWGIANKMHRSDDLSKIINSAHINNHVLSFFNQSSLSEIPSQINPLSIINAGFKTTITGEGGITNEQAIVPEMQALHPTHLGFLDPINTPESKKIGVTLNLTIGTSKEGNELLSEFKNVKTGKIDKLSPLDAYEKVIALPNQELKGNVTAIIKGKQEEVDASKITHILESPHHAFTASSQALPALHYNQANRAGMASRHINQAISLIHREAPLVQVKSPLHATYSTEELFGKESDISHVAPEDLTIKDINDSHITAKGKSGKEYKMPLFKNFEMFNKAYLHHETDHITPGMTFKKGDVIADSNFTKNGVLALGANLRTAYMPYKGLNFEDGIVVSESAAKKLTSTHIIQNHIEKSDNVIVDKKKFVSLYPTKYTKKQLDKIGNNGLAKPGAILDLDDPYALVLHKTTGTNEDLMLNRLHKSLVQPYKDKSETWDGVTPGHVVKAIDNVTNSKIHIKHDTPAMAGDKLALRHGNKGVITAVLPDAEMPHNKENEHTEVIISPLSIITRMSMGQMLENSASKIAKKTGKPYLIDNFNTKENQLEKIKADLIKHGISDTETLIDPSNGKEYGNVMVGYPLVEKLFKTTKANLSAREIGSYDIDHKPIRGGEHGSKSIDHLTLYSLLSHGQRGVVSEVSTVKGDANSQFWQNLQNGLPLPKPQTPFAYKKFEALLTSAGVNIKQDGNKKILTPLTDKNIDDMAHDSEIQNFRMLDHKLEPVKGGLFDISLTGGSAGQKWSKITLAHPLVNPMFEQAVKNVLGLRDSNFQDILKEEGGHEKIKSMLANIDIKEEISKLKEELPKAPKTKKDQIIKRMKILKSLDSLGMKPDEAYILSKVPVAPPQYRPIFELPNGSLQTADLNHLYRDLGLINNTIKENGTTPQLSAELYKSLGAIQGLMSPVSKQNEIKGVKGIIPLITGNTPKTGFFQQKVLRKQQDLSARATAILNNNLHMDQIAIPEKIAKVIYKPFAMKDLINKGYSHKDAEEHIDEFTPLGKKAIQASMMERPVLMNRAPSLHKFSIMAFQPTLTKGLSIETPGIITKPFSLDYDGDTVTLHVPASEKARKEAFNLLPSKNLYNPRARTLNYTPDQEAIIGLHFLSQNKKGIDQIKKILPHDIHVSWDKALTKKDIEGILAEVAEKHSDEYNTIVTNLKVAGDNHATSIGFSVGLKDIPNNSEVIKSIYAAALSNKGNDQEKLKALLDADKNAKEYGMSIKDNNFITMAKSGARGSAEQVKQILMSPGIMQDHNGNAIMRPVLTNYGTGMNFADYWTTSYGARKGSLDKQLMTAKPGALNKEIVNTTMHLVITKHDCGTHKGLEMRSTDPHVVGRYLTSGELVTQSMFNTLKKKEHLIEVRSPATCELTKGICQKCYGIDEYGSLPKIGDNVGIKAAQSISEPLTQAAMKTFHLGGTISGSSGGTFGGFEVIENFLEAPETFKNKATLATKSGEITKITLNPTGGHYVYIDEHEHFIPPHAGELIVSKGDKVKKGDSLNNGIPHPTNVLHLLGAEKGIQKISDTLHKLYKDSGISMDRKNIETVVRATTGFGIIKNEGSHPKFVQNDLAPLHMIEEWNNQADVIHKLPVKEAHGMILSDDVSGFKAGTKLDKDSINKISEHHSVVKVKNEPIEFERTLIGVKQAPIHGQDWIGNLAYRYMKRGIQQGATYGYSSDIHGVHPIAPFVTGQMTLSPNGSY